MRRPSPSQMRTCAARSSSTAIVSGPIRPVFSASGTKTSGPTSPRCGCCQRTSASTPVTSARAERRLRLVVDHELAAARARGAARRRAPAARAVALLRAVVGLDAGRGRPWRRTSRCRRGAASCRRRGRGRERPRRRCSPRCASRRRRRRSAPRSAGAAICARLIACDGVGDRRQQDGELVAAQSRDGVSRARRPPRAARAISRSSRSPCRCPSVSLISLKWSRSISSTAM